MNHQLFISDLPLAPHEAAYAEATLRDFSNRYKTPWRSQLQQTRYALFGNFYTGVYSVAFCEGSQRPPWTLELVGKELKFVSEEEFFAHYTPPKTRLGLTSFAACGGAVQQKTMLTLDPLGVFSVERLLAWRILAHLFQSNNPYSPLRHVIESGECYDCQVVLDEQTLQLRLCFEFASPKDVTGITKNIAQAMHSGTWIQHSILGAKATMLLNFRMQPTKFRVTGLLRYRMLDPEWNAEYFEASLAAITPEALQFELEQAHSHWDFV
ncbi:hypothetical protein [Corynebacterium freiburgense]|uniref:hypothetical protein n=1 Tax=Corynebacterium freiburgense TaxID=556548 RepID=UPI0003FB2B76|nr:hypothetical protein [Corynebacterium freiburgense]WJZ03421.1 hypothetical protein CFREI_10745 [Corynebacterium freiburgense]